MIAIERKLVEEPHLLHVKRYSFHDTYNMAAWHVIRAHSTIGLRYRRGIGEVTVSSRRPAREEKVNKNSHMTIKNEHLFPRVLHDILAQILNKECYCNNFPIFVL